MRGFRQLLRLERLARGNLESVVSTCLAMTMVRGFKNALAFAMPPFALMTLGPLKRRRQRWWKTLMRTCVCLRAVKPNHFKEMFSSKVFFSEGGMSKLQWETGVYAKMLGECSEPSHPSNDFWTPVPAKPVPSREVA